MNIIRSLFMTFSMFSCLPTKKLEWKKENMTTSLAFLPLVGVCACLLIIGWVILCELLQFGKILFAGVAAFIPTIISGGIHIDGFCDTVDALSSHADKERKRAILKDSHIGTFAVLWLIAYFLITFALYAEFDVAAMPFVSLTPIFSRITSAFACICSKTNSNEGLLSTFTKNTNKKKALTILAIIALCTFVLAFYLNLYMALAALFAIILCMFFVLHTAKKEFDGLSGDLAGFLLVISELFILLFSFIAWKVSLL